MPKLGEKDVSEKEFYRYVESTMTGALITDYPKMLYKAGEVPLGQHDHQGGTLLIAGKHKAETLIVTNEDEELAAVEDGWSDKLPGDEPKRGPGRPAKSEG